jgi:hypothetical protein
MGGGVGSRTSPDQDAKMTAGQDGEFGDSFAAIERAKV